MFDSVFTAAQVAAALQWSKRVILDALKQTPPSGTKVVHGNEARAWSKEALPQNILTELEEVAARRKTTVDALLTAPPRFRRPQYPLSHVCEETIERAGRLQCALAPALARLNDVD